jgi:hypothetical protein
MPEACNDLIHGWQWIVVAGVYFIGVWHGSRSRAGNEQ